MMKTLLLFIAIFATLLPESSGGRAPTWDSCNCYWDNWSSWTACSSLCGGGRRQRDRIVWHDDIPRCDGFEKCATNDMGSDAQLCNNKCFNGGTFRHWLSLYGQCDCKKGTRGKCCDQIVTCGQPSTITNGQFTGSDFSFGHTIVYVCNPDYNMTVTSKAILRCTEHGTWSNTAPECLYAVSCRSSPCQNGAACRDLLGGYQCTCLNGWTGRNCDTDIQPPVIDQCPSDRHIFTMNMTYEVNWREPIFHDPMGNEVEITKNYPASTFDFPWGVFTVQYSAVKPSNGLTNECSFNVTIKPNPCKPLVVPENGYVVCNNWMSDYANICRINCKKGHNLPPAFKQDNWYNCGASGNWIPSAVPSGCVPSSSSDDKPKDDKDNGHLIDCTNNTETRIAKNHYIDQLLESNFNSLCLDYRPSCDEMNVIVLC